MSESKYGYDEKGQVLNEEICFMIKCTMRKRWASQFVSMLKYMEQLGGAGASRKVSLFADGDGDFRPKFELHSDSEIPVISPITNKEDFREATFDAG